jgi:hypothetical protein
MTTLTASTPAKTTKANTDYSYSDGHFDASTHAPAKQTTGQYYEGYLDYTRETGKAPF